MTINFNTERSSPEAVSLRDVLFFFFSSRRRHTRYIGDWSSDVCSSDLLRALSPRRSASGVSSSHLWYPRSPMVPRILALLLFVPLPFAATIAEKTAGRSEERRVGKE